MKGLSQTNDCYAAKPVLSQSAKRQSESSLSYFRLYLPEMLIVLGGNKEFRLQEGRLLTEEP